MSQRSDMALRIGELLDGNVAGDAAIAFLEKFDLTRINASEIQSTARERLGKHHVTMTVLHNATFSTSKDTFDRNQLPSLGDSPKITFPEVQRVTMGNGLKVVLL